MLSLEQYEWLERKGVKNIDDLIFLNQDRTYVRLKHRKFGYLVERRKETVGWVF